jgi:ATP-dependent RNA helicase DDX19/DBP5
LSGRTGRFGRKGISINFVHDKKTWLQMEQIEKELGRKIMRIETNDLDEMEEVGFFFLFEWGFMLTFSLRK